MAKSTQLFTVKNNDNQILKYFFNKAEDPAIRIQFNLSGSKQRFHLCKSEAQAAKIQAIAEELGHECYVAEVTNTELEAILDETKNLPKLRNRAFPEPKAPKAKKVKEVKTEEEQVE